MSKTATRVELEPIDRLEDKVKRLVALVDRLRAEQSRAAQENERLGRELEAMRGRLASSETSAAEIASLKEERDMPLTPSTVTVTESPIISVSPTRRVRISI